MTHLATLVNYGLAVGTAIAVLGDAPGPSCDAR